MASDEAVIFAACIQAAAAFRVAAGVASIPGKKTWRLETLNMYDFIREGTNLRPVSAIGTMASAIGSVEPAMCWECGEEAEEECEAHNDRWMCVDHLHYDGECVYLCRECEDELAGEAPAP